MLEVARVASLASGRGGLPSAAEWPWVLGLFALVAVFGYALLQAVGLTRVESATVAGAAPMLVLVDVPLGLVAPGMGLAANLAGCVLPIAVGVKVLLQRRIGVLESASLLAVGIGVAFLSSHVEPGRGILLQYRVPAVCVGIVAAALLHASPMKAGAAAFAAGGIGVLVGADAFRLHELVREGATGRIVLGGAGLLDGILLVALLASVVAAATSMAVRFALTSRRSAAAG